MTSMAEYLRALAEYSTPAAVNARAAQHIPGVYDWKLLPDGRLACLAPLLFGARYTIATVRELAPTDEIDFLDESWDFNDTAAAFREWPDFDGTQPESAIRHSIDGRTWKVKGVDPREQMLREVQAAIDDSSSPTL